MQIVINSALCKSCGYCVHFCPKDVLEIGNVINNKGYKVAMVKNAEFCIGCKRCAVMCPDCAIEIKEDEIHK